LRQAEEVQRRHPEADERSPAAPMGQNQGEVAAETAAKSATKEAPKAKRTLSAQGGQNIIDALRQRMAANRAEAASTSEPKAKNAPKARKTMSAAGRRNIIEASKRYWEKKASQKKTA
jgi:hypothetical protein